MSIRAEDVYRLAKLAKLRISVDAVEGVERDLSKILQMVDQLREVDTSGVEPMVHLALIYT